MNTNDDLHREEERIANDNLHLEEERIDALDHLIFRELGQQAQWQQTMNHWEQRARQQRRLRFLPVLSNIASVAALFILGLIVEAMVPGINLSNSFIPSKPATEKTAAPTDSVVIESDIPPVEADIPPVEAEVPPVESDIPPVEADIPPVESDIPPVEADIPPVEAEIR